MRVLTLKLTVLTVFTACFLATSSRSHAQTPAEKPATTWRDLGFSRVPDGLSNDLIPMFEGLNAARGKWTFEGEVAGDDPATAIKGSLNVGGNANGFMIPFWQMAWSWPAENPEQALVCNVMAEPRKEGFNLMLIRMGPVKNPQEQGVRPKGMPTTFQGTWNLDSRTITWTERDIRSGMPGQAKAKAGSSSKQKETFEMVVAADGKIHFQNSEHFPRGQMTSSRAIERTGEPPAEPVTLVGDHRFATAAEVLDRRIKPWLPPQAKEISLLSERGGHYARYKVEEEQFIKFLDDLWQADNGKSAHKREERDEGEFGSPARIAKLLKTDGEESLENFKVYYGPSKASAAITIYYYDQESGVAYHDRGYW